MLLYKVRKQGISLQLPSTCNPNENNVKMDCKNFCFVLVCDKTSAIIYY